MARFKKSEWNPNVTQAVLKEMLGDYYNEFGLHENEGWTKTDVQHFLQVNHWLYKEEHAREHHCRTVESILTEMLV